MYFMASQKKIKQLWEISKNGKFEVYDEKSILED